MENETSLWPVIIMAIAGFLGATMGAVVRPLIDHLIQICQRKTQFKKEALKEQLNELYRPLFLDFVIMPNEDPEHYFDDWSTDKFHEWLNNVLKVIIPKIHLVPEEILEKVYYWREIAAREEYGAEKEVRHLYNHIEKYFSYLRKELGITS